MHYIRFQRQKIGQVIECPLDRKALCLCARAADIAIDQPNDFVSGIARGRRQVMAGNHSASNNTDLHVESASPLVEAPLSI